MRRPPVRAGMLDRVRAWIILSGEPVPDYWKTVTARYSVAAQPDMFYYPTQRPEINLHAFGPLPAGQRGVHILRRKAEHRLYHEAEALLGQSRSAEALQIYRAALEIDPAHALAHAGAGAALFNLEHYEEARQSLGTALAALKVPAPESTTADSGGRP